jgi:hypothetical protein
MRSRMPVQLRLLRCRSVEAYAAWQRGCMGPPMGGAAPRRGVRETAAACGMARQLRPAASTSTQASGPRVAELARSLLLRRPSPASTSQSECNAPPRRVTSTAGPLSTRSWPRLQARRQRRSALQGPPSHSTSCRSGTRPLHSRGLMRSSAAAQCGRRSCVEAPSARLSTTHADPRAESHARKASRCSATAVRMRRLRSWHVFSVQPATGPIPRSSAHAPSAHDSHDTVSVARLGCWSRAAPHRSALGCLLRAAANGE